MYKSILETIGKTPLVQLNRINPSIYAKVESANPGGSIKDRIALAMVEDAEKNRLIKPGDTIIEPTSGNTGIGLAMVCAVKGYQLILTMPASMSVERRKILAMYGAKIVLTPAEKGMKGAVEEAQRLANENNYFQPQQFNNPANPEVHRRTTALEILEALAHVDIFVCAVGTGGTLTGVAEVLKKKNSSLIVIAVEPADSPVLSGGKPGVHKIQGIGAGFIPKVPNTGLFDEIMAVTSEEAYAASRMLARKEGILAGISSGANLHACLKATEKYPGKNIVTVFPDTSERYISTELFDIF